MNNSLSNSLFFPPERNGSAGYSFLCTYEKIKKNSYIYVVEEEVWGRNIKAKDEKKNLFNFPLPQCCSLPSPNSF